MADEARLSSLLLDWQERYEQGQDVSAGELCRDCPELLPELQQRIAALKRMDRFVKGVNASAPSAEQSERSQVAAPPARVADRNLLFGILALQMDFIGRDALIPAMNAWVLEKATPLGQILMRQGNLTDDEHALLTAVVQKHLQKHGDDAEKSLAAVSSVGSMRAELEQIADADLHATLDHVSVAVADEPDREAANGSSVGAPTAAG